MRTTGAGGFIFYVCSFVAAHLTFFSHPAFSSASDGKHSTELGELCVFFVCTATACK